MSYPPSKLHHFLSSFLTTLHLTLHLIFSSVCARFTFAQLQPGLSLECRYCSVYLTLFPSNAGEGENIFPDEPQSAGKVPDERLRVLSALPWLRRGASHLHSSSTRCTVKTSHPTRSPASWGVFSDAPMSRGNDRTHGYSPNATIFYDYALPLSTNKTGDERCFLCCRTSYRDRITPSVSALTISQRAADTLSSYAGEKLNVQKGQNNCRYGSLSLLQLFVSLSVSSSSGGPISNLGEAVEDEQLLQAWRGSVAGNTAHPKDANTNRAHQLSTPALSRNLNELLNVWNGRLLGTLPPST